MPSPNVDQTLDKSHYVIRGGIEGRNRLIGVNKSPQLRATAFTLCSLFSLLQK
jgi:hypothetical protein